MPHDIFICYSSKDQPTVDSLCLGFEEGGLRTWMASRDILPSAEWAGAIIEAINSSRLMLLVFSSHANRSKQVLREVERAANRELPILPVRIEDLLPSGSMEYFLSTPHWFDAIDPPVHLHIDPLVKTIRSLLAGNERVVFEGLTTLPRDVQPSNRFNEEDRRLLPMMRDRVRQFWIEGVLDRSIYGAALLNLRKETRAAAVEHPWERILELPNEPASTIPNEKTVAKIFHDTGQSLLVLGEPGGGKTTTLLELARDLMAHSGPDSSELVPVIFNLSSWSNTRGRLLGWLIEELKTKYSVGPKLGQRWLEQGLVIPLLDGLDEVRPAARPACVQAINVFAQEHGFTGLAVSCRTSDYMAMTTRLRLTSAIVLQPLSDEQVQDYLKHSGQQLDGLLAAISHDEGLRELARTPFMLSVMSLAYENAPAEVLAADKTGNLDWRAKHVLETYVDRMFKRRGKSDTQFPREQILSSLAWLAQQMNTYSATVFAVEQIQPSWFRTNWERLLYLTATRMIIVISMLVGIFSIPIKLTTADTVARSPSSWVAFSQLVALAITPVTVDVIAYGLYPPRGRLRSITESILRSVGFLLVYFTLWVILLQFDSLAQYGRLQNVNTFFESNLASDPQHALFVPAYFAILFWLSFGIRSSTRSLKDDIRTDRLFRLRPNWKSLHQGSWVGGIGGTAISLAWLISHFVRNYGVAWQFSDVLLRLAVAMFVSLLGALIGVLGSILFGRLESGLAKHSVSINGGVRRSFTVGCYRAFMSGCLFMFLNTVANAIVPTRSNLNWVFGFGSCVVGFFVGGGLDPIYHYVLRSLLSATGYLPMRLLAFFAEAERLILVRRVGNGYIFVHRLLQEYFQSLVPSLKTNSAKRREITTSEM